MSVPSSVPAPLVLPSASTPPQPPVLPLHKMPLSLSQYMAGHKLASIDRSIPRRLSVPPAVRLTPHLRIISIGIERGHPFAEKM